MELYFLTSVNYETGKIVFQNTDVTRQMYLVT